MLKQLVKFYRLLFIAFLVVLVSLASTLVAYYQQQDQALSGCGVRSKSPKTATSRSEFDYNRTGKLLVENNCKACHSISEIVVGPPLSDIFTKKRKKKWLYQFIRNPQKLIASGDKLAIAVYNQYEKQMMPAFDLTNSEIDSILAYIKYASSPIY